jgi:hypothetical protein
MPDIRQIKKELLAAFNSAAPGAPGREDALDSALRLYFSEASHMPRPLTFEAILKCLKMDAGGQAPRRDDVQAMLDRHASAGFRPRALSRVK